MLTQEAWTFEAHLSKSQYGKGEVELRESRVEQAADSLRAAEEGLSSPGSFLYLSASSEKIKHFVLTFYFFSCI